MKKILVDSSVWISYFKDDKAHQDLIDLIKNNRICTNNLILTELIPFLKIKGENELIEILLSLPDFQININWEILMNLQFQNIRNGINKVGIPDLIILENVIDNNLILYTEDRHFELMSEYIEFELYNESHPV